MLSVERCGAYKTTSCGLHAVGFGFTTEHTAQQSRNQAAWLNVFNRRWTQMDAEQSSPPFSLALLPPVQFPVPSGRPSACICVHLRLINSIQRSTPGMEGLHNLICLGDEKLNRR